MHKYFPLHITKVVMVTLQKQLLYLCVVVALFLMLSLFYVNNYNTRNSNNNNNFVIYDNNIEIPVPALIIGGPPKTGTNTLRSQLSLYHNLFAFPVEHFYWAPSRFKDKNHPCEPIMTKAGWNNYLNLYKSNRNTLSDIINIIYSLSSKARNKCIVSNYTRTYINLKQRSYSRGLKKQKFGHIIDYKECINPLNRYKYNKSKKYIDYCFFFEKAPGYIRSPFVTIWIANLLKKTKYLTILRNPINHVWSNYFHFGGGKHKKWNKLGNNAREKYIINAFNNISSIDYLNNICININIKYIKIKQIAKNGKERYLLMREYYKLLIIEYFKRRYIKPKDIMKKSKIAKTIWSSYIVPILFIGIFVNDQVFINNKWNEWDPISNEIILNYKYIQFEWLWNNTLDSMRLLKCWITKGFRINNNKCEYKRNDKENKKLFYQIKKTNSKAKIGYSSWYKQEIINIFTPCTQILLNIIINDRPNLVIGEWLKWESFHPVFTLI